MGVLVIRVLLLGVSIAALRFVEAPVWYLVLGTSCIRLPTDSRAQYQRWT